MRRTRQRRGRGRFLEMVLMVEVLLIVWLLGTILVMGKNGGGSGAMTGTVDTLVGETDGMTEPVTDGSCVVCVDPGHGGRDEGTSYGGRIEKDDNLAVGLALRDALTERGISVVMTRETDEYVSLEDRVAVAENAEADYYISLHRNFYDGDVCGLEIWLAQGCSAAAENLAQTVEEGLTAVGIQDSRGIRSGTVSGEGDYYVLTNTTMPAVLLELGFIQDKRDNELLDTYKTEYAVVIADAVAARWEEDSGI